MFLDEVTGAFRSRLIPALEDLEVCPGSSSLDGGERLCAKIGLFQSRRSVFGQASISARKPIAGESNHALSRKRRCWQGTDIEDRPGLNTGTSR
jgi:hypothetical protein